MNISIDKIKLELPSRLEDICKFSFDFDNLMKVIEYFFNNNIIMVKEIKDLRNRINEIEVLHAEIENLKLKTTSIEKSNDNMNRGFIDIKERFLKSESKVSVIDKKNQEFQNILDKNEKTMEGHEINLNNLNKVVEENIKSIKQIQENFGINLEKMSKYEKEINEIHLENIRTHELIEKNNNRVIQEQNNNEKEIESINGNISEINVSISAIKNNFEKKFRDFDNGLNNIMDTIKTLSTKGVNNEQNEKNLFKLSMNEIERDREKLNSFIEENKIIQDKKDREQDTLKKIIDNIKIDIDSITKKINNIEVSKPSNDDVISEQKLKNLENKFITEESLEKLNEYIKKITKTISTFPNREEFETLNRNLLSRINKIEQDKSSGLLSFDAKMSKTTNTNNIEKRPESNINYINNLVEKIKMSILSEIPDIFKDLIKKEGKNLDISKNPQIIEIVRLVGQHSDEINNNNKTVIDLRRTIFAIEADKKLNLLVEKTTKLEDETERNKKKIFDLIKTVEGYDDTDDYGDERYEPETIKGKLNLLEKSQNALNDKFLQVESKYKSLTKEIKEDIKSNLRIETVKIIGQFREKLEIFTRRFEEELRSKIDQMGLNNFEKKMNTKIYFDLKDKLNRNEMQKNNNAINRKIDSLENKISKTLVDTIIDLQMDEAPLIIKKTPNNMDICASCNQFIQRDRGYTTNVSNTEQNSQPSQNLNKNLSSSNNKFRKTFYGFNRTQTSMPKINNVMSLKKELPDINNIAKKY